jgi:hypothetical protein
MVTVREYTFKIGGDKYGFVDQHYSIIENSGGRQSSWTVTVIELGPLGNVQVPVPAKVCWSVTFLTPLLFALLVRIIANQRKNTSSNPAPTALPPRT